MTMLMSPFGKGEVRRTGGYLIFVVKILRLFEPPPLHKGGQNAHKIRHSEHSEESYDVPKMFRFAQHDVNKKKDNLLQDHLFCLLRFSLCCKILNNPHNETYNHPRKSNNQKS